MPVELAWTRALPTIPGLYVWRAARWRMERTVLIAEGENGLELLYGGQPLKSWAIGGEWLGPLPE